MELAEPPRQPAPDVLDLLVAAARGDIVSLPVLLRRLIRVPEGLAHIVRLPVSAVRRAGRPGPQTPDRLSPRAVLGPAYSGRSTAEPSQWVARSASSTSGRFSLTGRPRLSSARRIRYWTVFLCSISRSAAVL